MDVAGAVVSVLELAERGTGQGRRALDHLQLRLHSWRLTLDPQTRVWTDETRQAVADLTLQPEALNRQDLLTMIKATRSQAR